MFYNIEMVASCKDIFHVKMELRNAPTIIDSNFFLIIINKFF